MYGSQDAESVFAHQLWAACSLFQVTRDRKYWKMTEDIYKNWIVISNDKQKDDRLSNMYFPVANYDNPIFYGLLCMAQSSPDATGLQNRCESCMWAFVLSFRERCSFTCLGTAALLASR